MAAPQNILPLPMVIASMWSLALSVTAALAQEQAVSESPAPLWAVLATLVVLAYGVSWLVARPLLSRRAEGRDHPTPSLACLQAGPLVLDPVGHWVEVEGRRLDLTATEFKLLVHLVGRPGQVFSREELLRNVWGHVTAGYSRTVDTHVQRLREKLGAAGTWIETVRGVGYRFRNGEGQG